ncbi:polysaccharide pyruvyl transferase family protein [Rhodanobacter sp. Root480]|uniref:polysaccharide pyruvyl transferase family protein n=1 Tax=Rhodanobacter sp. Root480 TaxID=1736542 RepID=UPI0009E9989B|nr:polysaccharide pyruvyl transferase family protein [Rhodanobacter sp. Root480]
MHLYINNLRELPNFGCRTTGNALEELLKINNIIEEYDATESASDPGAWASYAKIPLKDGGIIPRSIYDKLFSIRRDIPRIFRATQWIDKIFGASHDYITNDPNKSIIKYRQFSKSMPELSNLENKILQSEGIIINGEGTLILGHPTQRDALYLLFVIALAKELKRPVYLLNAMISSCPYSGENLALLRLAKSLLKYCKLIAVRESKSHEYVAALSGESNLRLIPDALFTWGPRIRYCVETVRREPKLCISHPDNLPKTDLVFDRPYVCISGSSSAWRYKEKIHDQFVKLINHLKEGGQSVICVETCDGDNFLEKAAKECNVFFLPKRTPIMAAMGVLAGAQIYITGRYHPAIMASANGVPCIFLTSNSHKTTSIQLLLGYKNIREYPVCPDDDEIADILQHAKETLANRADVSHQIYSDFERRRIEANEYVNIVESRS